MRAPKFESGKVYRIEIFKDGISLGDKENWASLQKMYREHKELHLGRTGMRSEIIEIEGHKYQARRVFTGLYG